MKNIQKSKPVVVCWDLETTHNIVAAFDLFSRNPIPSVNILEEKYIISAAWTEVGSGKIHSVSVLDDPEGTDRTIVETLLKLFESVDAMVAHYGDKFDMRFFMSRVIFWGFDPPPPVIQIDTYKIARSKFKFNSNRLDYLGKFLGIGGKAKTEPGLWLRCLKGERKAIKEMIAYNVQDIDLLEKVYERLSVFVSSKINFNLNSNMVCCSHCGSNKLQYRGTRKTTTRMYSRYQCQSCGHWGSGIVPLKKVDTK